MRSASEIDCFIKRCLGRCCLSFVIHSVASDKEYLQRMLGANPFSDNKYKCADTPFRIEKKMERNEDIILVIDDDRASRRMLARALSEAGYTCRESSGGIEALEMLHAEVPSLLLLDFHMPGLNGAEVLSRLASG